MYHAHARPLQRSKGDSASGAGAYMLDLDLRDPWDGRRYNQTGRHDHDIEVLTAFPGDEDFFNSPAEVFAAVDAFEKRRDATLGLEFEAAIPLPLSRNGQREAVADFARAVADRDGRYVVAPIHYKDGNPHAHCYITDRPISRDKNGGIVWGKKDNSPAANKARLQFYREAWEVACNRQLEREGHEMRIDHRSFADRGLDFEVERHEGRAPDVEVLQHNRGVQRRRRAAAERALMDAGIEEHHAERDAATAHAELEVLEREADRDADMLRRPPHPADRMEAARRAPRAPALGPGVSPADAMSRALDRALRGAPKKQEPAPAPTPVQAPAPAAAPAQFVPVFVPERAHEKTPDEMARETLERLEAASKKPHPADRMKKAPAPSWGTTPEPGR